MPAAVRARREAGTRERGESRPGRTRTAAARRRRTAARTASRRGVWGASSGGRFLSTATRETAVSDQRPLEPPMLNLPLRDSSVAYGTRTIRNGRDSARGMRRDGVSRRARAPGRRRANRRHASTAAPTARAATRGKRKERFASDASPRQRNARPARAVPAPRPSKTPTSSATPDARNARPRPYPREREKNSSAKALPLSRRNAATVSAAVRCRRARDAVAAR